MEKSEFDRVQGLPSENVQGGASGLAEPGRLGLEGAAIDRVPQQRMAAMAQMNPDLVGTSGFQVAAQQGRDTTLPVHVLDPVVGDRLPPLAVADHGDLFAIVARAREVCANRAGPRLRYVPDQGEIGPLQGAAAAMVGELGGEALMGEVVLGDDEQAARVLVEAVDDAGPAHAADPGQAHPAMRDQPIDEGAVLVPRRRVHDEPCRLVDDDEILVLMDDGERQSLAERLGGKRRRNAEIDPAASPDLARGIAHHDPVAAHEALAHQALEPGTGEIVEHAGKDAVEPLGNGSLVKHEAARLVRAGDHGKHRGGHREDSRHFAPESACGVRDASLYEPPSARKLPSSSGLGRRPLTAKTGVRFPLGAPTGSMA